MNNRVDLGKENLARSSLLGLGRGLFVHSIIYPIEVVKIRLQCSQTESKSLQIALELFRNEGISAFYKGLCPQLMKTSIKQVWCWPVITGLPQVLEKYQMGNFAQQAFTGLSIATIDALISTPLERAKVISALTGKSKISLKDAYKNGWCGLKTHWAKLSVNWITFLTTQKYLRDYYSKSSQKPLSLFQLSQIGVQVALVVSFVSAPFDLMNTLKQTQNLSSSHKYLQPKIFKLYRGWSLNAFSLTIHNIASVSLIDVLSRRD